MKWYLLFILCLFTLQVYSQPRLGIEPHNIIFEDMFNRLEVVYFINEGDEPLVIENIVYGNDIYFLRFDGYSKYPFTIQPDDSVRMDCILAGYLFVPSADTVDTMYVYNNGVNPIEDARIKIDYFDDDFRFGTLNGYVTDGSLPLAGAIVYFYYQATFIIDTAHTDAAGFYSKQLPPGSYLAAAETVPYYVGFHDSLYDPFTAKSIRVSEDSVSTADIKLTLMPATGISVEGNILDSIAGTYLKKGTLVIRKGTHNPTRPINPNVQSAPSEVYTTFIRQDGTYRLENIIDEDYYYIQSFSDYYVPTYYTANNTHPAFWQQADSIYLNGNLSNVNIEMPRDSSVGGGNVTGNVIFGDGNQFSDVTIYVQSLNNNLLYTYGLAEESGNFDLSFLPYGNYKLVGQKLNYENAYSVNFTIDSINTDTSGIILNFGTTGNNDQVLKPEVMQLYQNYPNPFNPSTTIEFFIPEEREIKLILFNLLGEEISVLKQSTLREGYYSVTLDGTNLSSGIYLVTLQSGSEFRSRKVVLLK